MLCITGFDGVLGGVTGVVYSIVFGVSSAFVKFTLHVIVGMTTFGSNSYLVFSRWQCFAMASSSLKSINFCSLICLLCQFCDMLMSLDHFSNFNFNTCQTLYNVFVLIKTCKYYTLLRKCIL